MVLTSKEYAPGQLSVVRARCKMWGCEYCAKKNAEIWRAHLLETFNNKMQSEKWCFLTITAHPKAHITPEMTILNLQQVWKRLYDRMRRHYKKPISYVRVFEEHKKKTFHMHVIVNIGAEYDKHNIIPKTKKQELAHPECVWLKTNVAQLGGGPQCHMKRIKDYDKNNEHVGLVVGYVTKYIMKNAQLTVFPKNQRRIQTSRDIGSPDTKRDDDLDWKPRSGIYESDLHENHRVVDISTGFVIRMEYFENVSFIYPPEHEYDQRQKKRTQ